MACRALGVRHTNNTLSGHYRKSGRQLGVPPAGDEALGGGSAAGATGHLDKDLGGPQNWAE